MDDTTLVALALSVALFFTAYAGAVLLYAMTRPTGYQARIGRRGLAVVSLLGVAIGAAVFGILLYQYLFPIG
ncbi:MAG: hypothetical protein ACHQZR_09080 [Candidatus Limnocylindrales bacterium]